MFVNLLNPHAAGDPGIYAVQSAAVVRPKSPQVFTEHRVAAARNPQYTVPSVVID